MISEDNLNRIYNDVINNIELTTKKLNEYGFNSTDITKLIKEETIERVKRGTYELKDTDKLFNYGRNLIIKKDHENVIKCFKKCLELDPTNLGACFQLFIKSIENKDYDKVFEYYEELRKTKNIYYQQDTKYHLYLLSLITEIPEKYKEEIKKINFDDIKVLEEDLRYDDVKEQNRIRKAVIDRRPSYALHILNESVKNRQKYKVQDIINKTLLIQAIEIEKINKETIINLTKEKKYDELIQYLIDKQEQNKLTLQEKYTLKLCNQYKKIEKTSKIPEIAHIEITGIFEAIDACDFEYALKLNKEYNEKFNENNENTFGFILNDICELLNKLKENINYSSVFSCLLNNDIEKALDNLKIYMKNINKVEYEYLIENLIKISVLEQDSIYTKPMIALTLITNDKYQIEIEKFIQEFYVSLAEQNYDKAQIYLDIISKSSKIQSNNIKTENLCQILELSRNIIKDKIDTIKPEIEIIEVEDPIETPEETEKNNDEEAERTNEEEKLIEKKYDQIKKRGIVVLKKVNKERVDKIFEALDKYNDILGFVIDEENNIVLRYYNPTPEKIKNEKELLKEANTLYKNYKYKECINKYYEIIKILPNIKAWIFARMGISYVKTRETKKAIQFLTIASKLARKENVNLDFSDLILKLKGEISSEDIKPKVIIKESEFEEEQYYGIKDFDEINKYIHLSGLDVETACKNLNKTQEQTDIIKLIYARQYYIQGDFEKGDQFIKSVESCKEKTETVIKLLDRIRTNKRLYPNKNDMQYSLKIKP